MRKKIVEKETTDISNTSLGNAVLSKDIQIHKNTNAKTSAGDNADLTKNATAENESKKENDTAFYPKIPELLTTMYKDFINIALTLSITILGICFAYLISERLFPQDPLRYMLNALIFICIYSLSYAISKQFFRVLFKAIKNLLNKRLKKQDKS